MSTRIRNINPKLFKPVISVAVLIGFLSIQFHSFSHIDLSSLAIPEQAQKIENQTVQITGHSSSHEDTVVDCPDCVLTKHLQTYVQQTAILLLNSTNDISSKDVDELLFGSPHYLFQLRAPPLYSV